MAEHFASSEKGPSMLAICPPNFVSSSRTQACFHNETERHVILLADMAHSAWFSSEMRTIFTEPETLLWRFVCPGVFVSHEVYDIGSRVMTLLASLARRLGFVHCSHCRMAHRSSWIHCSELRISFNYRCFAHRFCDLDKSLPQYMISR